jgi:pullulanase/glycogen debranching enzyme
MQIEVLADPDAAAARAAALIAEEARTTVAERKRVAQGRSFPLGATLCDGGANFSVFSKHSTAVELCLFDRVDDAEPARVIALDPRTHRTYHYWHTFIPGIAHGQLYAFRVQGPLDPANGLRFDASKTLLDPYGKCVARPAGYRRGAACQPGDNAATAFKSVVVDLSAYDWEGDAQPRRPFERTVTMPSPPLIWDIETDPVLATVKLIAEAWDAGGLYEVGSFVGDARKEWNGKFRDDVRSFLKSDDGMVRALAYRLTGSPDVYAWERREPEQSVNFVTCHDGFTLNDLVSYNAKHNEANGEQNHDGSNNNFSWNCGVEGPSDDPEVERLRTRQVKNFLALTLLSVGTPMLLAGDEVRSSQRGNNNAYCRNDALFSFDWTLVERYAEVHRFTKQLITFRLNRSLPAERFDMTLQELLRKCPIQWHGVKLNSPDWCKNSHTIAANSALLWDQFLLHVMINAYWEPLEFELPPLGEAHQPWRRCIDTYLASPEDVCPLEDGPKVPCATYRVQPRSIVILFAKRQAHATQSTPAGGDQP